MPPKRQGKKKPAAGDWGSDDDITTPDLRAAPSEELAVAVQQVVQPAKKGKKAKKGKSKGRPGDDWASGDDVPDALAAVQPSELSDENRPACKASGDKTAAASFTMLDDSGGSASEDDGSPPAAAESRPAHAVPARMEDRAEAAAVRHLSRCLPAALLKCVCIVATLDLVKMQ